jgi:hypothetical protein
MIRPNRRRKHQNIYLEIAFDVRGLKNTVFAMTVYFVHRYVREFFNLIQFTAH